MAIPSHHQQMRRIFRRIVQNCRGNVTDHLQAGWLSFEAMTLAEIYVRGDFLTEINAYDLPS